MLPLRILPRPVLWRSIACRPLARQGQQRCSRAPCATIIQSVRCSSGSGTSPPSPSNPTSMSPATAPPPPAEPRLSLTFTCTVHSCNGTRSSHSFTKRAYEKGVVLVECPGCRTRHLIADHLGWFKDGTSDGKHPTIEDILRAKGEKVVRGRLDGSGAIEYAD